MPELRTGFDYHLAHVVTSVESAKYPSGTSYYAECEACGWQGPERMIAVAAEDDADAHDLAENPS